MTDRDVAMVEAGTIFGLICGMLLSWLIATTISHQRDFWQRAYCAADHNAPSFCNQKSN